MYFSHFYVNQLFRSNTTMCRKLIYLSMKTLKKIKGKLEFFLVLAWLPKKPVSGRNRIFLKAIQGPLKKWMEHSQELHLSKIHSRGGSYYTPGLDGGWFFGPWAFIIPKKSVQDLSNEGSKCFFEFTGTCILGCSNMGIFG